MELLPTSTAATRISARRPSRSRPCRSRPRRSSRSVQHARTLARIIAGQNYGRLEGAVPIYPSDRPLPITSSADPKGRCIERSRIACSVSRYARSARTRHDREVSASRQLSTQSNRSSHFPENVSAAGDLRWSPAAGADVQGSCMTQAQSATGPPALAHPSTMQPRSSVGTGCGCPAQVSNCTEKIGASVSNGPLRTVTTRTA